jgi:hypothetical protein
MQPKKLKKGCGIVDSARIARRYAEQDEKQPSAATIEGEFHESDYISEAGGDCSRRNDLFAWCDRPARR